MGSRGRGRPKGSLNKTKQTTIEGTRRGRGRPKGSLNKTKQTTIEGTRRGRGRPKGSLNKTKKYLFSDHTDISITP